MKIIFAFLVAAAIFLGAVSIAAPAAAQDDDTGYSLDSGDGDSTGYSIDADDDTRVLGTTLSRTGANTMFLVVIAGAAILVGVGLDRWSTRLEPKS